MAFYNLQSSFVILAHFFFNFIHVFWLRGFIYRNSNVNSVVCGFDLVVQKLDNIFWVVVLVVGVN
jgi:hypothetical protein